jgi:RNA polymerase sigma-70 factor (ECF subfamily)
LAKQVSDLIESLNDNDREMLTLRHAEGLTTAEVAEALNIEPMTARKRYGRALRRLVELVAAAGLDADLSGGQAK